MMYYRCKCGHLESVGSMSPNPCQQCEKCGSDLAPSPDLHRGPKEHAWETRLVDTDAGKQELTVCRWCHMKKTDYVKVEAEKILESAAPAWRMVDVGGSLEQIAELKAAGWKAKTSTIWVSPEGKLYLGPHGAWKVMRAKELYLSGGRS